MAVSKEDMLASYVLQFAVLLVIMTNLVQYFYANRGSATAEDEQQAEKESTIGGGEIVEKSNKSSKDVGVWPAALMAVSAILLLLAPAKNMVFNVCMLAFQIHGFDSTIEMALELSFSPFFTTRALQLYTIAAYVLMLVATAGQLRVGEKFVRQMSSAMRASASGRAKKCEGGSGNATTTAQRALHKFQGMLDGESQSPIVDVDVEVCET